MKRLACTVGMRRNATAKGGEILFVPGTLMIRISFNGASIRESVFMLIAVVSSVKTFASIVLEFYVKVKQRKTPKENMN